MSLNLTLIIIYCEDAKCNITDDVKFFRTAENYLMDLLHDGPEGHYAYVVHHFFKASNTPSEFRSMLKILNSRLLSFDYHNNSISNKFPLISEDEVNENNLRMSDSEMMNFIMILPKDSKLSTKIRKRRRMLRVVEETSLKPCVLKSN